MIILIPEGATGIAIKLSGGADSSIVYYALLEHLYKHKIEVDVYVLTVITDSKKLYNYHAQQIIEFCGDKFDIWPKEHRVEKVDGSLVFDKDTGFNRAVKYIEAQRTLLKEWRDAGLTQAEFSGTTMNPPDSFVSICEILLGRKGRDPSRDEATAKNKKLYSFDDEKPTYVYYEPLIHKNKQDVRDEYAQYGVLENLYPLTWSCEQSDNFTGKHCGKCFWCYEREWGFGIIDPSQPEIVSNLRRHVFGDL